jgi:signal transduction histidine kinase
VAALAAKSVEQAIDRNLMLDAAAADQVRRTLEQGAATDETRFVVVGGARRALRIHMAPAAGGVGALALDVTDLETAREDLDRIMQAHDETLDALDEAVVVFGPDRRLLFHNRAFELLWGIDPAFLAERPSHGAWLDHLKQKRLCPPHANYQDWRTTELLAYGETGDDLPENVWELPQGRTLRVARRRHPLGGLLLIFSDMTNELQLRSQYAALLKAQSAALDRLHEGIVVFGLDGRLRLYNAAFAAMWKLEAANLETGMDFDRLCGMLEPLHHDHAEWRRLRARISDPDPNVRAEYRTELRRSDGATISMLTRPLPDGATLIAFMDITADKRVEDALRERAEAFEQADRLKTELVENVSYQLRTPLQTIHGYAEVLAKLMAGPLNDRQRDQLHMILAASEALSKLIDTVLDVALIEAKRLELSLADVAVADIVKEAAAITAAKAQDADVTLRLQVDENAGVIRADPQRLKQVLVNLISNALRFSPRGGEIRIEAARNEGDLRLAVIDEGSGMDPEDQAAAFDHFVSGDRRGAGLGLALVRSFIELHGGWVALKSEPGQGVEVVCHLPIEPKADVLSAA